MSRSTNVVVGEPFAPKRMPKIILPLNGTPWWAMQTLYRRMVVPPERPRITKGPQ